MGDLIACEKCGFEFFSTLRCMVCFSSTSSSDDSQQDSDAKEFALNTPLIWSSKQRPIPVILARTAFFVAQGRGNKKGSEVYSTQPQAIKIKQIISDEEHMPIMASNHELLLMGLMEAVRKQNSRKIELKVGELIKISGLAESSRKYVYDWLRDLKAINFEVKSKKINGVFGLINNFMVSNRKIEIEVNELALKLYKNPVLVNFEEYLKMTPTQRKLYQLIQSHTPISTRHKNTLHISFAGIAELTGAQADHTNKKGFQFKIRRDLSVLQAWCDPKQGMPTEVPIKHLVLAGFTQEGNVLRMWRCKRSP